MDFLDLKWVGAKWGKNSAILTPNDLIFPLRVLITSVPILVKINQEMRPLSTTDGHTD